ncbi:MAG TPA: hypothetical protein VGJ14_17605 [Sporichthyaceae bacterium]|jgi:hypothetical protein
MIRVIGWTAALVLLAAAAPAAAAGDTVNLDMSNFRFCRQAPCLPTTQGYVRNPTGGPVPGSDNPAAIIDVPSGATVVWTYRDSACDAFSICPGHMIMIENGTPDGQQIGMAAARKGPTTVSYKVTDAPGTLIHYFCNINRHDQFGQTGILRVIG